MNIESFLNDFDNQNEQLKADKERKELENKLKIENQEKFIKAYKNYFNEQLGENLRTIAEKLKDKFDFELVDPKDFQGNNCLTELILKSKFEHHIKKVRIHITTEGGRKLITLSGDAETKYEKRIGEPHYIFQGSIDEFMNLNFEEKISEILNKIFIRR